MISPNAKILRYFIKNGADLKAKDIHGYESFEVALETKKQNAIKTLLYHQINIS